MYAKIIEENGHKNIMKAEVLLVEDAEFLVKIASLDESDTLSGNGVPQ